MQNLYNLLLLLLLLSNFNKINIKFNIKFNVANNFFYILIFLLFEKTFKLNIMIFIPEEIYYISSKSTVIMQLNCGCSFLISRSIN